MRFADFASALEALEETSGRIGMYRLIGGLFEEAAPEEIDPAAFPPRGAAAPALQWDGDRPGERHVSITPEAATTTEEVAEMCARQQPGTSKTCVLGGSGPSYFTAIFSSVGIG